MEDYSLYKSLRVSAIRNVRNYWDFFGYDGEENWRLVETLLNVYFGGEVFLGRILLNLHC